MATTDAGRPDADLPAWWEFDDILLRFVGDLVHHELRALRPGASIPPGDRPYRPSLDLVRDLGADSLERLALASALAQAVHLAESGIQDYLLAKSTLHDWAAIVQAGLREYCAELTFRTSGSSGTPKACTHRFDALAQEIDEFAAHFRSCRRILSAVPGHHIYGFLFTILLPVRLGIARTPVVDLRLSSPASLRPLLRAGDLVVGHPEFWRHVAAIGPAFAPGVDALTSTAPLPVEVGLELERQGLTRLMQIYGSSETAGVGWRIGAQQPYRLLSYFRRAGEGDLGLLRRLPDGRVVHVGLQDRLIWHGNEEFIPGGRIDQGVQVGGANVFPSRVQAILLQHPRVADAAVRLMRADEGSRLKAFIVARESEPDPASLRRELESWMAARLTPMEVPRSFSFGPALPRDAKGKPADWVIDPVAAHGCIAPCSASDPLAA